jgi:hypothetical protein
MEEKKKAVLMELEEEAAHKAMLRELRERAEKEKAGGKTDKAAGEPPEEVPASHKKERISPAELRTSAFFKTKLGAAMGEQFFKNHYLLAITNYLRSAKRPVKGAIVAEGQEPPQETIPLEELITEGLVPDQSAMLAHRAPDVEHGVVKRFIQLMVANSMNTGRGIANAVTRFCLKSGKRRGVPTVVDEIPYHPRWDQLPVTEDDTREGNYHPDFYKGVVPFQLQRLYDDVTGLLSRDGEKTAAMQRIENAFVPVARVLGVSPAHESGWPEDLPEADITEVQVRAISKHFAGLREALQQAGQEAPAGDTSFGAVLASLDETQRTVERAYNIKPEHYKARFR